MKLERRLINLGIYSLYRNLLMMASRVLAESEFNGIKVDREYLNKIIAEQGKYIEKNLKNLKGHPKIKKFEEWRLQNHIEKLILKAEEEIEELENIGKKHLISTRMEKISRYIAGNLITKKEKGNIDEGVNFNSPNQMVDLLFESPRGFRFKFLKITGSGNPSTDEETLLKLKSKDKSGFIEQLLKHRELTKIYSTYMVGIKDKLTPDSYIHGNFLLHGTVTGRLSSRKPNLQNIPRDTTSSLIKKMYIAPFGYLILQLDYSQAELRVMAQMANEKTMIKWFNEGRDIHLATACRKWDYDYDKAKNILDDTNHEKYKTWKIRRKQAKIINFGIIYEEGPAKLAEGLSDPESGVYVDEQEAREFLANYFKLFPNVKKFINRQHRFVEKYGYVRNLFGRYRRLPDIWGYGNYGFYLRAQRQSTNSPVQGTASDFALFSSILIREEKLKGNLPFDMPQIWTVHDSLGFYIRPNMIHKVVPILEPICENPETKKWFDFEMTKVTMKIDFEIGPTWLDLKPYDSNKDYTKG
jgi:DNA polymerase-1